MAIEIIESGRLVYMLWGEPRLSDLAQLLKAVSRTEQRYGEFVLIWRVPEEADLPGGHVREALQTRLVDLVDRSLGVYVILEGSGCVGAAKRAVLSAMLAANPNRRRVHVHSHYSKVPSAVSPQFRREVTTFFRELSTRGLLTGGAGDLRRIAARLTPV